MGHDAPAGRLAAEALDARDPLAPLRSAFELPEGVIYLDGNSLGAVPATVPQRLRQLVEEEWGRDLIASWDTHGWVDLPQRAGAKLAPLLGADPARVLVADSTSINLFKALAAALRLRPERRVVVAERGAFPTDLYVAEGLVEQLGSGFSLRLADPRNLLEALRDDVAVVSLAHVDYRSGRLRDLQRETRAIHDRGALAVWDLAHSAGVVPIELDAWEVDFAVGCGYKFLNGGPGAPAFVFAGAHVVERVRQPLSGWFGHALPFAFEGSYRPAPGIARFACGTPPILGLAALDAALDVYRGVDLSEVRRKSIGLGELLVEEVLGAGGDELDLASPADPRRRGSQVSFRHPHGRAVVGALRRLGVVGDFRPPDILRFGLAPLYLRYVDVWEAARRLIEMLATKPWEGDGGPDPGRVP